MLHLISFSTSWSMIIFCVIHAVVISIVAEQDITSEQIAYLKDFGYLEDQNRQSAALQTQESLQNSIKTFQRFARLPVTGVVDQQTIQKFKQPRCGVKDEKKGTNRRDRRYVLQGSKWEKKDLTYQIENWTEDLSKDDIRKTIRSALMRWQRASQIRFFHNPTGSADIMIKFTRGKHNDQYAFDGPGGTLAHAFYPGTHPLSGDTHFDDDETFTVRSKKGKNFYWVALHEFGHALGLDHSNADGAIMFPWYEGYKGYDVDLSDDDKRGIQALYGLPKNQPPILKRVPDNNNKNNNECLDRVKSIYRNRFGETIVINIDKVYVYDKNLRKTKGPIPIGKHYRGLSSVDAVYTLPNRLTVFFHEDGFSEYVGQRPRGTARNAQDLYGSGIFNIDAAFYWSVARKIYIFKGDVYWRYDPYKRSMDSGYPKQISEGWTGVPDDIDAVYEWDKKVFFFKDHQYYRFDEKRYEVLQYYPRPISSFLVCKTPRHGTIFSSEMQTGSNSRSNTFLILPAAWYCLVSSMNIFISWYLFY